MRAVDSNLSSSVLSDKVAGTFSYLLQGKSYNSVSLVTGIMLLEKKDCVKKYLVLAQQDTFNHILISDKHFSEEDFSERVQENSSSYLNKFKNR